MTTTGDIGTGPMVKVGAEAPLRRKKPLKKQGKKMKFKDLIEANEEPKIVFFLDQLGIYPDSITVKGNSYTMELEDKDYGDVVWKGLSKIKYILPKITRDSDTAITVEIRRNR